jgi:hypothetical protein
VRTFVDLRLVDEARASGLRFRCDDCAHFDATSEACAHGYPVAPHRPGPLEAGGVIVFCKEFELGQDAP